jgi:hypothetical protein
MSQLWAGRNYSQSKMSHYDNLSTFLRNFGVDEPSADFESECHYGIEEVKHYMGKESQ